MTNAESRDTVANAGTTRGAATNQGRSARRANRAKGAPKERKRALAREFLAVREWRHRTLGAELAEFEQVAELNEGLAEYTLVRSLQLAARQHDFPDRLNAGQLATGKRTGLHELTEDVSRSIRLRF